MILLFKGGTVSLALHSQRNSSQNPQAFMTLHLRLPAQTEGRNAIHTALLQVKEAKEGNKPGTTLVLTANRLEF